VIDFNKPVMTRRGGLVEIIKIITNPDVAYPIIGMRKDGSAILSWTQDGRYDKYGFTLLDLIQVPDKSEDSDLLCEIKQKIEKLEKLLEASK
jgi:hypothetical protein